MLIALARLGSPELVGRFALALAITSPVILLSNLQLRVVQATDAKLDYSFGHYLAVRLITAALALTIIIGIATAIGGHTTMTLVIIAVGVTKTMESLSDIFYGLMQLHERMDRIAISSLIKGPLVLVALSAAVYLTKELVWGSVAMAACSALVLSTYDVPNATRIMGRVRHLYASAADRVNLLHPIWDRAKLVKLAVLSLPMGFTMMLVSLNANIPRYFIARHSGEHELGIFAAMSYLLVAGSVAIGALAESASPKLAKHYAAGDAKSYETLLAKLVGIGAAAGAVTVLVAVAAGQWILNTLYGPDYSREPAAFTWIAIASAIVSVQWFLGTGITAARCFRVQVVLLAINTAATITACAVLIPKYGLLGSAIALAASNAILAVGTVIVVTHAVRRIRHQSETK